MAWPLAAGINPVHGAATGSDFLAVVTAAVAAFAWREENKSLPELLVLHGNMDVRQVNLAFNMGAAIAGMLVGEARALVRNAEITFERRG